MKTQANSLTSKETTCRTCGKQLWVVTGVPFRWQHTCPKTTVKVYTEEEKKAFEAKRKAGEI